MSFAIVVTTAGRAALINAANTGTLPVTITQAGVSETAHVPAESDMALPDEIKRLATVAGEVVANDTIHVSILDSSADVYSPLSVALYLGDGTLFAIGGGGAEVLYNKAAASMAALAIDIVLADIAAISIAFGATNFTNPPASTEIQGVVELATVAEAQAGIDALRALTPGGAKAAVLGWLLAQDGAGSGLDADLLDGQHGSYYSNIPARLGFTPLNAVTYTAADILAKLLGVDGAGSGLDTDLLDGQQGAWYADIAARLGFTPVNKAGDTITGDLGVQGILTPLTPNAGTTGGLRLRGNSVTGQAIIQVLDSNMAGQWGYWLHTIAGAADWNGAGGLKANGAQVWSAGNDGSGSGLDADLLDGLNSNQFMRITDASIGVNGYIKIAHALLANDLIFQWCNVACSAGGASPFNWPTPFPNNLFATTPGGKQGLTYSGAYSAYLSGTGLAGGTAFGNNGGGAGSTVSILAIGN